MKQFHGKEHRILTGGETGRNMGKDRTKFKFKPYFK